MSNIDAFQLATNGVGPGWSTFNMASSGFGFDVEIIIRPVQGGGGSAPTVWIDDVPHEVLIRIRYKGKTWEQKKVISRLTLKSIEKVVAGFRRLSVITDDVVARFNRLSSMVINVVWRKK